VRELPAARELWCSGTLAQQGATERSEQARSNPCPRGRGDPLLRQYCSEGGQVGDLLVERSIGTPGRSANTPPVTRRALHFHQAKRHLDI
jgi:hypothetical protein